jgi:hypothetical protein
MHLLLGQRVRASFSLTLKLVVLKMILLWQFSSAYKRVVLSTIESSHSLGQSRAMTIRRFRSGSSLASFVRRVSLKSSLMKRLKRLMMNPNIDLHLTLALRNTTPCLA